MVSFRILDGQGTRAYFLISQQAIDSLELINASNKINNISSHLFLYFVSRSNPLDLSGT